MISSFIEREKDPKSVNSISMSELSEKFLDSKTKAGYPQKTINGHDDTYKLLIGVLGDVCVDSLTHQDGKRFVQVLKKLPVNVVVIIDISRIDLKIIWHITGN